MNHSYTKCSLKTLVVVSIFLATVTTSAQTAADQATSSVAIKTEFKDGITTVTRAPLKISGPRDEYHSFHLALSYSYPGEQLQTPEHISFEIQIVVKRHTLNSDLYIVFFIDGEKIFLSSVNRWAVKNPFPGRKMIGERILMKMPVSTYLKLVRAKSATIKMGGTEFELGEEHKKEIVKFVSPLLLLSKVGAVGAKCL